jgi:cystathionine beta-lyase/cystathionine gamma-synthase
MRSLRGKSWPTGIKPGHLVRFSIGLEQAQDLQADLLQALQTALSEVL